MFIISSTSELSTHLDIVLYRDGSKDLINGSSPRRSFPIPFDVAGAMTATMGVFSELLSFLLTQLSSNLPFLRFHNIFIVDDNVGIVLGEEEEEDVLLDSDWFEAFTSGVGLFKEVSFVGGTISGRGDTERLRQGKSDDWEEPATAKATI